jgi:hypothetical protein
MTAQASPARRTSKLQSPTLVAFLAYFGQTKHMNSLPTPRELAAEAIEALRAAPEDPSQHFQRLVDQGWINMRGQVTKLLGGDVEPEKPVTNGTPVQNADH